MCGNGINTFTRYSFAWYHAYRLCETGTVREIAEKAVAAGVIENNEGQRATACGGESFGSLFQ